MNSHSYSSMGEVGESIRVETGGRYRSASFLHTMRLLQEIWEDSHYVKFDLLSEKSSEELPGHSGSSKERGASFVWSG